MGLGLALRYLQTLLTETGASFSERVLELRLQKARAVLTSPRQDKMKVSEIAYACGFSEVSYSNRCFAAASAHPPRNIARAVAIKPKT